MSVLNDIYQFFSTSENKLNSGEDINNKQPLHLQVKERKYRIDLRLDKWKNAVVAAENVENPDRSILYRYYDTAMEDDHLLSQVRTARFNVQMSDYHVKRKGKEDESLQELFDTTWFFNYLQHAVDTELYGHSLIELVEQDGVITGMELIPRVHVKPESQEIILSEWDIKGLPYGDLVDVFNLVEIGEREDLGLLKSISKAVTRKQYNLTDWGRRNERFGMPFIITKTSTRDKKELDKKEQMLRNFGSNAYAILDDQDEFEMKEPVSNTGGGHRSFADYNEYIDKAISVIVNGQTGTTDEKAFVGSAEVHERTMNKYTLARMRRIQYHINDELIPRMVSIGYPLADCKFQFNDLDEEKQKLTTQQDEKEDAQEDKKKD